MGKAHILPVFASCAHRVPDLCVSLLEQPNNRTKWIETEQQKREREIERKNPFYNMVFTAIHYHGSVHEYLQMFIIWKIFTKDTQTHSRWLFFLSELRPTSSNELGIHTDATKEKWKRAKKILSLSHIHCVCFLAPAFTAACVHTIFILNE